MCKLHLLVSTYYLQVFLAFYYFFSCYLAVPRPTFDHYRGHSLTQPMLIVAFYLHFQIKGHREHRNEIGSLSPYEGLVGFEPATFHFLLQRLNPLGHSPQDYNDDTA